MSLLKIIRESKNIRKLFGKAELEIIERQLLGIKLKPSQTTRLSRDIRKKFEAIKELANYSDYSELKKGAEIKRLIEDAKEVILETKYYARIKKIILFGSTVDNTRTFRSDIDIAVEFDKIDVKESTEFRIHVLGRVNDKTDIQVYNVLPDKIKKEIDQKGEVIWKQEKKIR